MVYIPKPYEVIEYKGGTARKYEDGSIRNERGQALEKIPSSAPPITSETARTLAELRKKKKHERAMAGANRALEGIEGWEKPQGDDFIEALVEAQTKQALTGDPAYTTKAAEFVMTHTGNGETKGEEAGRPGMTVNILQVSDETLDLLRSLRGADVIEAESVEPE